MASESSESEELDDLSTASEASDDEVMARVSGVLQAINFNHMKNITVVARQAEISRNSVLGHEFRGPISYVVIVSGNLVSDGKRSK